MDNKDDFYEILQVHPSADPDIIQAAYRRLVFRYHPDRNTSPEAAEIMRRLNQAYEVLSDPQRRAAYDLSRAERSSSRPTGSAQETHGSQSYSYGWQQWHESLRDSYLVQGLRSVFLGAVSSVWGFLLLFVSLFVALAFVSFIWWLSDILYGIGWWPLGALARIAAWLMIAAIALRLVFMVGMGAVILGRWLWRYADHVVKPKVPVSFGAVFIIVILAISIGIGLYTGLNSDTPTPTEFTPLIDGDADAAAPMNQSTPTPTPVPTTLPKKTYWDGYGNIVTPAFALPPTKSTPTPTAYPLPSPTLDPYTPYTVFHNQEYRYNFLVPREWIAGGISKRPTDVSWKSPDGKAKFGGVITPIQDRTINQWADGIIDVRVTFARDNLFEKFELTSREVTTFQGFRTILMRSREQFSADDCTSRATHLVMDGPYVDMWLHMSVCENDMDKLQPELDAILRSFTLY
jgi:hypothetical protein